MAQIIGDPKDNILEDTLENGTIDETVTSTASLTTTSPVKLTDIALLRSCTNQDKPLIGEWLMQKNHTEIKIALSSQE